MKSLILKTIYIFSAFAILTNCASTKKSVHGDDPLIDPSKVVVDGSKSMQEKVSNLRLLPNNQTQHIVAGNFTHKQKTPLINL